MELKLEKEGSTWLQLIYCPSIHEVKLLYCIVHFAVSLLLADNTMGYCKIT